MRIITGVIYIGLAPAPQIKYNESSIIHKNEDFDALEYSDQHQSRLPRGRRKLASVIRASGDVIGIDEVVAILKTDRTEASKLLSRWTGQGWLRRIGRGAYVPVPLDALQSENVLEDPWIIVPALYRPAYIGGWTAAEHWDLTEQLFRDIIVMTAQPVRDKHQTRHGAKFFLHHIQEERIFGTKSVWRGRTKVPVSDVHRTIVDVLDNPAIGAGIQHVSDCLGNYLKRVDRDDKTLFSYADQLGNGAVFKRLGFLAENLFADDELVHACQTRLTAGNAKLDSAMNCTRLVSKWRLWVPPSWKEERKNDR